MNRNQTADDSLVLTGLRCAGRYARAFAGLVLCSWLTAVQGFGSAFSIAELGARAAGMGTAFTAVADDASALYYNPAGIAFQDRTQLQMDNLVVVGLFRFTPSETPPGTVVPEKGYSGSIKPKFIPVASLYMTKPLSERLSVGFGVFTPFGLSANFTNFNDGDPPETKYVGRFAGTRARLESFWFQPTVAYKVTPNSAVSVGVAWVHTHLMLEQSILNPLDDGLEFGREAAPTVFPGLDRELAARSIARMLPEGRSRIAGTSNRPGYNLAYLYRNPDSHWNLGFNFRSAVTNRLKGEASFAFGSGYTLEQFVGEDLLFKAFPNQPVTGSFTTPATYALGVANTGFWNSTISAEVRVQDYQRFANVPLNFSQTRATNDDVRTPAEQRLVFDFRNSIVGAVGIEKRLGDSLSVRGGYYFDRSPVVDKSVGPLFPDTNRHNFSVGASKKRGNMELTLFYQAMNFVTRNTDVPANAVRFTNGEYRNFAHLAGAGLRFHIGEPK